MKRIDSPSNFLKVHQAARLLNVSVGTIRRWSQEKKIHGVKVGLRGDWRFTKRDLLTMVSDGNGKQGPQTKKGTDTHNLADRKQQRDHKNFRLSDPFFRQIIDSLEDYVVFTTDIEGEITSWSLGAERITGYKQEEIIGKNASVFFTPEDLKKNAHSKELATAIKLGKAQDERWHVRKGGGRFWGSGLVFPLKDDRGDVQGFTKIARDLTISKQVKEVQTRLAAIVASSNDAIIAKTLRGVVTNWNPAAERIFGYKAEEAIGRNIAFIIPPDRHKEEKSILNRIGRGERIEQYESVRVRKDGKKINVSLTISPIKDNEGKIIGASKIARDITLTKKAQRELAMRLRQQEFVAKLGLKALGGIALSELMDDAVLIIADTLNVDNSKILEFIPDKGKLLYRTGVGWKKGVMGKKTISAARDHLGGYAMYHRQPIIFTDIYTERRYISPKILYEHGIVSGCHVVILGESEDVPYGILGACSRTPRKFSNNDIDFMQSIANILAEGIHRKRQEHRKDDFISMASHELKTPITTIKAYTQILQKAIGTKKLQPELYLEKMKVQIDRLTDLITDLLDISKIEKGRLAFSEQPFDFDTLVEETVEIIAHTTDTHTISLQGKTNKLVVADRDRISQVIINLLTNAIKYSPKNKEIQVRVRSSSENVSCSVTDNGIGIPRRDKEKIFERFYRVLETTTRSFPGLGVGLYISYEIIKRHGGKITVKSKVGHGSTFTFTIPIHSVGKKKEIRSLREDLGL